MAAKRRLRFSSVAGPSPKRGRAARGDDDDEEERPPQEPDESEEEAPPAPPPLVEGWSEASLPWELASQGG